MRLLSGLTLLGMLSSGLLITCPNHLRCLSLIASVMVDTTPSCSRMPSFLIWSRSVTPRMALRHLVSNTSTFPLSSAHRVHVSAPYMAIVVIRALNSLIFNNWDTSPLIHTDSLSNPKAEEAIAILLIMSSEIQTCPPLPYECCQ